MGGTAGSSSSVVTVYTFRCFNSHYHRDFSRNSNCSFQKNPTSASILEVFEIGSEVTLLDKPAVPPGFIEEGGKTIAMREFPLIWRDVLIPKVPPDESLFHEATPAFNRIAIAQP
ncbi:MAG: hypothetical protein KDA65_19900, partial [Planctomycetaceae bacterium]|nr:hypothetical protein [Planctomycetaceae bacterium]